MGEYDFKSLAKPRMWSDAQMQAGWYLTALLQGTSPPVGMHPFTMSTRFVMLVGYIAQTLGIEQSARIFQEALLQQMGYDYDRAMGGEEEVDCRLEGV